MRAGMLRARRVCDCIFTIVILILAIHGMQVCGWWIFHLRCAFYLLVYYARDAAAAPGMARVTSVLGWRAAEG